MTPPIRPSQMHRRPQARLRRLIDVAWVLLLTIVAGNAAERAMPRSSGSPPMRISTVGGNGMPRNSVPRDAYWNFGRCSYFTSPVRNRLR